MLQRTKVANLIIQYVRIKKTKTMKTKTFLSCIILLLLSSCNNTEQSYSKSDIIGCWTTIAYYSTDYGTYLPIPDVEYAYMFCFLEDGSCLVSSGDNQSKFAKIPSYSVEGSKILLHGYTGEKVIIIEKKDGNTIDISFLGTNTRANLGTNTRAKLIKFEP